MSAAHEVEVVEADDHVEIRGASGADVRRALQLLEQVGELRWEQTRDRREELITALMSRQVPLIPPASLAQAHRVAAHRDALLATPTLGHDTLAELRGVSESNARTWVSRRRAAAQLFTVTHDGRTLVPAFQVDDDGEPRPELRPLLAALTEGGVRDWALWTWLTTASPLLSGEVPESVARTDLPRALRAAQRFAAPQVA